MFERFTDRGRQVVVYAQEQARTLDHEKIGTEHILLALIQEKEGVGARALESLGISLEAVHAAVEKLVGSGNGSPTGHIPFTPRAKKALELSLREALQLGHNYIGTEHILLGLIREGEGIGAQVLVGLGADLSKVRLAVLEHLNYHSPVQAPKSRLYISIPDTRRAFVSKPVLAVIERAIELAGPGKKLTIAHLRAALSGSA